MNRNHAPTLLQRFQLPCRWGAWFLLLLLSLPAYALTPVECRSMGVWVDNGTIKTGKVIAIAHDVLWCNRMTHGDIPAGCPQAFGKFNGVWQWGIHYSNACAERHVRCHADYQTYAHTQEFPNNDALQIWLEQCPDG
jgi:hypothetical protein